jgi:hypothetical protein
MNKSLSLLEQQETAWKAAPENTKCIFQFPDGWWGGNTETANITCGGNFWLNINASGGFLKDLLEGEIGNWDWRDTLQTKRITTDGC